MATLSPSILREQARAMFINFLRADHAGKVAVFETRDFMTDRPHGTSKFIGIADSKDAARDAFGFFYVGNNCNVVNL